MSTHDTTCRAGGYYQVGNYGDYVPYPCTCAPKEDVTTSSIEVLSTSRTVTDLWVEVEQLRAELADEKAAHAKTMSNFEEYVEAQREH